jgi:hypothetical protein
MILIKWSYADNQKFCCRFGLGTLVFCLQIVCCRSYKTFLKVSEPVYSPVDIRDKCNSGWRKEYMRTIRCQLYRDSACYTSDTCVCTLKMLMAASVPPPPPHTQVYLHTTYRKHFLYCVDVPECVFSATALSRSYKILLQGGLLTVHFILSLRFLAPVPSNILSPNWLPVLFYSYM